MHLISRFGSVLLSVGLTAGVIALLQRWLGFAPLILFVVPIVMFVQVAGIGAALAAAVSAALIGDYYFVEPVREVTIHAQGLRLLVFLSMGAALAWVISRRPSLRQ